MLVQVLCRFPKWLVENFRDISKEKKIVQADLFRLATYFFVLEYKGKFDKETLDNMEFKARAKVQK